MKRRVFMGLGATSIAAGALFRTGAFSSMGAGRGVAIGTVADHEGALLEIEDANDPNDPPTFRNKSEYRMSVALEPKDDDVTFDGQDEDPFTFELETGDSNTVEIESETGGLTDIFITAILLDGNQTVGSIELQREFGVAQAEQISLTPNVGNAGNSGKVSFEVENTGDISVQIEAVAVNDATVNGDSDPDLITDALRDETGSNDAPGPIDVLNRGLDELEDTDFVAFSDSISLATGEENDFEADKLEDEDGGNARYNNGGTLDITFELRDGSRALLEMEI